MWLLQQLPHESDVNVEFQLADSAPPGCRELAETDGPKVSRGSLPFAQLWRRSVKSVSGQRPAHSGVSRGLRVRYDYDRETVQTGEVPMIYRGTVRNGVVVLPPDVHLPDGLDVAVQPVESQSAQTIPTSWQDAMRNGVPVFPPSNVETAPDLHLVNELRDETP